MNDERFGYGELLELIAVPRWHRRAACRGMGIDKFFPPRGSLIAEALMICSQCRVKRECGSWAEENEEKLGIWGGTTGRQRYEARKRKRSLEKPINERN